MHHFCTYLGNKVLRTDISSYPFSHNLKGLHWIAKCWNCFYSSHKTSARGESTFLRFFWCYKIATALKPIWSSDCINLRSAKTTYEPLFKKNALFPYGKSVQTLIYVELPKIWRTVQYYKKSPVLILVPELAGFQFYSTGHC